MKRSRSVSLTLMGATAITLTACGEAQETVSVFDSVNQCIQSGYSAEVCAGQQQNALANHFATAPRYADRAACEADFGTTHCMQVGGQTGVPAQIADLLKMCEAGSISQDACDKLRTAYPNAGVGAGLTTAAFFIPAMAAFMMALPRNYGRGWGGSYYYYGRPLYYPRDGYGYYRTADNYQITNRTGTDIRVPKSIVERPANVRTTTIARGGFGERAYQSAAPRSSSRGGGFTSGG